MNYIEANQVAKNFKQFLRNAVEVDNHKNHNEFVMLMISGYIYAIRDNTDYFKSKLFYNKILSTIMDETNGYNSQKVRLAFIELLDKIVC